ncbi:MAG: hypothetical protein M5R42_05005 [Rhodocyclaceae bacterium]|nr:hypothetical protein [Rhodocyclaceae bacterium]
MNLFKQYAGAVRSPPWRPAGDSPWFWLGARSAFCGGSALSSPTWFFPLALLPARITLHFRYPCSLLVPDPAGCPLAASHRGGAMVLLGIVLWSTTNCGGAHASRL